MSADRHIPFVVVTLPEGSGAGTQVLVRHTTYDTVEVDVRESPLWAWVPIGLAGGSFEERPGLLLRAYTSYEARP